MKYKPGDEVLIKAEITDICPSSERQYFVAPDKYSVNWVSEDKIIPMDKTYVDGLNDAWELAKKMARMEFSDLKKIFGHDYFPSLLVNYTYEEALAKIEAYEKEKEIKVNDEVIVCPVSGSEFFAVVACKYDNDADVMYKGGNVANHVPLRLLKKTGKHIDIESLLKQIGE